MFSSMIELSVNREKAQLTQERTHKCDCMSSINDKLTGGPVVVLSEFPIGVKKWLFTIYVFSIGFVQLWYPMVLTAAEQCCVS